LTLVHSVVCEDSERSRFNSKLETLLVTRPIRPSLKAQMAKSKNETFFPLAGGGLDSAIGSISRILGKAQIAKSFDAFVFSAGLS